MFTVDAQSSLPPVNSGIDCCSSCSYLYILSKIPSDTGSCSHQLFSSINRRLTKPSSITMRLLSDILWIFFLIFTVEKSLFWANVLPLDNNQPSCCRTVINCNLTLAANLDRLQLRFFFIFSDLYVLPT